MIGSWRGEWFQLLTGVGTFMSSMCKKSASRDETTYADEILRGIGLGLLDVCVQSHSADCRGAPVCRSKT